MAPDASPIAVAIEALHAEKTACEARLRQIEQAIEALNALTPDRTAEAPAATAAVPRPHVALRSKVTTYAAQRAPPAQDTLVWTEARKDVMRREYPRGTSILQIVQMVNALPGARPVTKDRATVFASYLGLRRPVAEALIAEHIAKHGVTVCPPAAATETTAEIPPEAREEIRKHDDALAADLAEHRRPYNYGRRAS